MGITEHPALSFDGALKRRLLLIYFGLLALLYGVAAFSCYVLDDPRTDGRGELIAVTVCKLGLLLTAPRSLPPLRYASAMACLASAPVLAVLFHDQAAAQIWSVVPLMFVAILVRTWQPANVARILVATMTVAAIAALLTAPAEVLTLWLVTYAVSITGASEIFGVITSTLADAAFRDPLTSVWNRAGVAHHATAARSRARRKREPLAVLVFDLDDFKGVNDRHGHLAGDEALTRFACELVSRMPRRSIIGRVGGDEFVAVISGVEHDQARALTTSLVHDHAVPVTSGVAVGDARTDDFERLFAAADDDLYRQKRLRAADQE